ncbi:MAG: DUF1552 domain-containing protein [Myxococcota bacterium]
MRTTRRHFLRGLAGFTLAIPVLPSLLPRSARAAGPSPQRFIAMGTEHGGIWQQNLYPSDSTLTDTRPYAGHTIRRGDLSSTTTGGRTEISRILSASSAVLSPGLVSRMNVMRGFDVPFYLAHHRGGHLGNYAENDGNGGDGQAVQNHPMPTIDQVLAWSNEFYPDTSGILERSLVLGGRSMSAGHADPNDPRTSIGNLPNDWDSRAVFRRIFRARDANPRRPVVDLVIEDYQRLRDSDRRISSADRDRLNQHMERLYELERKLNATASCEDLDVPDVSSVQIIQRSGYGQNPELQKQAWQLLNDVIVAAMSCDTCRIATMRVDQTFSPYVGDWHQEIAHQAQGVSWAAPPSLGGDHPNEILAQGYQRTFEHVFADLAAKLLAVTDENGETLLDNTLLQWTHESGPVTHDPIEMPVITAGSAGGAIKTGHYADFRNLGSIASAPNAGSSIESHTGIIYNQWLGTVLQAMGVPRASYERDGYGGYGHVYLSQHGWYAGYDKYGADVLGVMGERVPFVG